MDITSVVAPPPTATAITVNSGNNSSIGNSSSSSSSSGYGSATTTPTTPLGSNYETQTSTSTVHTADPVPVATIAAVTPFYNEAITTAQSQHRQQYYQQSYVHPGGGGAGGVQAQPLQQYTVYDGHIGSSNYQHAPNVERTTMRHAHTQHAGPMEKLNEKLAPNLQQASAAASHSSNVYKHDTSGGTTTAKPQAAATAFYAQPLHASNAPVAAGGVYFDPYKYKMPTKLPNPTTSDYSGYGNHHPLPTNAVAASYQQQYYAAAKSQLQEATYAAAVKPLSAANSRPNVYGSSNNASYYDKYEKYMYAPTVVSATTLPHGTQSVNAAAAYPPSHPLPTHHFSHETPTDSYRKTATAWHWNMEYSAGNSRSLPPVGGIPTATVSPTNTSYYPQVAATSRDAYYAHEKYAKYDKYSSYYHQQYIPTPPPTTRNVWPSSHVPHLVPPITERLQHTHPPLQHSHPTQHYAPTTGQASAANIRQNCCSQPPYQQQSCYYPRTMPHHVVTNAYPASHPQQSHFAAGSCNSKFSNFQDYPYNNKLKNSNDLYVSSPFDTTTPAHLNYNYAASTNQRYPITGATAVQHQSVNPAAMHSDQNTAYYNDLNPTYDNYASSIQQQQQQQHLHQQQQHHVASTRTQHYLPPPPYLPPNHGKSSLLDYRKPTTTQNTDCYMTQSGIIHLEDHVAGNENYPNYDIPNASSSLYSDDAAADVNTDKSGVTKNLSLRDFLSTWNEDEEENAAGEQINFVESDPSSLKHAAAMPSEISHRVEANHPSYLQGKTNDVTEPLSYKIEPTQPIQQVVSEQSIANSLQYKESFNTHPKIHVGIAVSSTVDVEPSQYVNLPDIIIDIEKSNNSAPTLSSNIVSDSKAFANFDVEKELDELQIKKSNIPADKPLDEDLNLHEDNKIHLQKGVHNDCNTKKEFQKNDTDLAFKELLIKQENEDQSVELVSKLKNSSPTTNFEDKLKNDVELSKTAMSPVQTEHDTSFDNPEHFLKDIEYDNTSHSNESTFEKEYETFINKIGSDTEVEILTKSEFINNTASEEVTDLSVKKEAVPKKEIQNEVSEDNKSSSQDDLDFTQNVKEFSKFYKRKRKLVEDNTHESPTSPKQTSMSLQERIAEDETENFPKVYTKICRKRKKITKPKIVKADIVCVKNVKKIKRWKPLLQYYKILHSLRRFHYGKKKVDTSALVQQHIALLKERHLPLIKRQSAKQFLPIQRIHFSPKTLKCLSVSIVNTEQFRQNILKDSESKIVINSGKMHTHVEQFAEAFEYPKNMEQNVPTISTNKVEFDSNVKENEKDLKYIKPISTKCFIEELNKQSSNIVEHENDESNISISKHENAIKESNQMLVEETVLASKFTGSEIKEICSVSPEKIKSVLEKSNIDILEVKEFSSFLTEKCDRNSPVQFDENSISSSDSNSSSNSSTSESSSSSDDETESSSASEASDFDELEALEKELSQHKSLKDFSESLDTIANKTDDNLANETSEHNKINYVESVEVSEEITHNDIAHVKKMLESDHEELDGEKNTFCEEIFQDTKNIGEIILSDLENLNKNNFSEKINSSEDITNIATKLSNVNDLSLSAVQEITNEVVQEMTNEDSNGNNLSNMIVDSEPMTIKNKIYDVPSLKSIVETFLNSNEMSKKNDDQKFDEDDNKPQARTTVIEKLSDLCKIALNSSFDCSELTMNINDSTTQDVPVECRELSVEEALAEMYRQAGVASDPEDYEIDDKEAQDVLLINLEEILDSDSDLYVLQCDMNENILGVVTHSDADTDLENTERVNTLQLVEILNSSDFERNENDMQLFNASNNFIVIDDSDDETQCSETPSKSSFNYLHSAPIIEENNDSQFDLPTIHHEEIVPDNYKKFEKEKFFKYLHEKYVQKNVSKFYQANRILKKYKRRLTKNFLKKIKMEPI